MKYYIDFEATQFSNEIISIGCVREDGDTFYSLVHSDKKVTDFITKLTGLTQEMIAAAPTPNEVFKDFWNWCHEVDTNPEFYCYGNCDTSFVKATFNKTTDFTAASMLGYLSLKLVDYAPVVRTRFGLIKNISLVKMAEYFKGEEITQRHNALEDALMLKYVADNVEAIEMVADDPFFEDWKKKTETPPKAPVVYYELPEGKELEISDAENNFKVFRMRKGKVVQEYKNYADAVAWVYAQMPNPQEKERVILRNVFKNIRKAATKNTQYFSYKWRFEKC